MYRLLIRLDHTLLPGSDEFLKIMYVVSTNASSVTILGMHMPRFKQHGEWLETEDYGGLAKRHYTLQRSKRPLVTDDCQPYAAGSVKPETTFSNCD